jgi:hypothetical protein
MSESTPDLVYRLARSEINRGPVSDPVADLLLALPSAPPPVAPSQAPSESGALSIVDSPNPPESMVPSPPDEARTASLAVITHGAADAPILTQVEPPMAMPLSGVAELSVSRTVPDFASRSHPVPHSVSRAPEFERAVDAEFRPSVKPRSSNSATEDIPGARPAAHAPRPRARGQSPRSEPSPKTNPLAAEVSPALAEDDSSAGPDDLAETVADHARQLAEHSRAFDTSINRQFATQLESLDELRQRLDEHDRLWLEQQALRRAGR